MPESALISRVKPRRVTQACDFRHRRGLPCKSAPDIRGEHAPGTCLTCIEYGQTCTRHRQPKKRGTKQRDQPKHRDQQTGDSIEKVTIQSRRLLNGDGGNKPRRSRLRDRKVISALMDVYLDSIHPIVPLFCERHLWVGWRDGTFPADESDYTSLLCMCALSAQHAGSGALFSDATPALEAQSLAQDYLAEALRHVPMDFEQAACVNQIRSYSFLVLLGTQTGNYALAHKFLGRYHGLCAHFNLHDEAQWPAEADACEVEVRRRLWWIMYRLEVHIACVRGGIIRCPEAQSHVGYPVGLHHPAFVPGRDGEFEDPLHGWNTTTDLYRVLEHVISDFRSRRRPEESILGGLPIAERLSRIKVNISPQFGSAASRSSDSGRNRCGFQASNILCTIHLARMISALSSCDFHSACQTANAMMEGINTIPIEYIRAAGSPLLQQLTGVGHMLAGVARKQRLSQMDQHQFKAVLMSMKLLLAELAPHHATAAVEEKRLETYLAEAERYSPGAATNAGDEHASEDQSIDAFGYLDAILGENQDGSDFFFESICNESHTATRPLNIGTDQVTSRIQACYLLCDCLLVAMMDTRLLLLVRPPCIVLPPVITSYFIGRSSLTQVGTGSSNRLLSNPKKNGAEYLSLPLLLITR